MGSALTEAVMESQIRLLSLTQIAEVIGQSRRVAERVVGEAGFPKPAVGEGPGGGRRLWREAEVKRWLLGERRR